MVTRTGRSRFRGGPRGTPSSDGAVRTRVREVAIVSQGPDDSREGQDDRTEDVGLPEHEDDSRLATDTASGEQNP